MNNKILTIVSITSAIILVLVTFTSVVGFQTVKTDNREVSPLFDVRSKRAIGEESNAPVCDYLRKGEIFFFPARNSRTVLIQRVLEALGGMSKEELNVLRNMVIQKSDEIGVVLNQLKDNPKEIKNHFLNGNANGLTDRPYCTSEGNWEPGCLLFLIADIFWGILEFFFFLGLGIAMVLHTILYPNSPTICDIEQCYTEDLGCLD